MLPMARTASRKVARTLATLAVGGLLLLLAAPARAEGEHWVPLYNKLARMLNERCQAVGGGNGVSLLAPSAEVTQLELEVLRGTVRGLAEYNYVVPDVDHDGLASIQMLIDPERDANGNLVYDEWGSPVLQSPSIFELAELPNHNAFTRIPKAYGCESYKLGFGSKQLVSGYWYIVDATPVLWEHFQELYAVISQFQWTKKSGSWTSNGTPNYKSGWGSVPTDWTSTASAAAQSYESQTPYEVTQPTPGAASSAINYGGSMLAASVTRTVARFALTTTVPSSSATSYTTEFFVYCAFDDTNPDNHWHANGDPVKENLWSRWASNSTPSRATQILSPSALGNLSVTPFLSATAPPPVSCINYGWTASDACAIMKWTFTAWDQIETTAITETSFEPPRDPAEQGLAVRCLGCTTQTCQVEARVGEAGIPEVAVQLGYSDASGAGPSILAYLAAGNIRLPNTGLSPGGSADGTLSAFSLDTQVESDFTIGNDRFVSILRPTGRVVTYHFALNADHGVPAGVDAANATSQALYDRGGSVLDLVFTESSGGEVTVHRFTGGVLSGVAQGPSFEEGEVTVGEPGSWPGLTWSGVPLSSMESPMYDLEFSWNGAGRLSTVVYKSKGENGVELIKAEISYTGAMITGLQKFRKQNGNWVSFDQATFTLDQNGKWTLTRPGKTVEQEKTVDPESGDETYTDSRAQTGGTARVSSVTYHTYPWGREIVARTDYDPAEYDPENPDGLAPQVSSYYDDPENDSADNYGRLKQTVNPDGSWTRYEYEDGRVATETSGFVDTAPDAENGTTRVTAYAYAPLANSGDDGSRSPGVPRTTVVTIGSEEVSRSYLVVLEYETDAIRCTVPAAWSVTTNLVTVTQLYASGDWEGHPYKITNPDGTTTVFHYEDVENGLMTTAWSGDLLMDGQTVTGGDGTKSVTVVDAAGRTILNETYDIASELLLSQTAQTQFDDFGRATRTDYLDGTFTATVYGCCGPDTVTDREGIQTQYIYDDLKRVEYEIRVGITTHYSYDVDGNVTATVRIGSSNGHITLSTSAYDENGRLISTTDAMTNTTQFAEALNPDDEEEITVTMPDDTEVTIEYPGYRNKVTLYPDGSTRVETYNRDGTLDQVEGTAAHPVKYVYALDGDPFCTQMIRVGTGGAVTEWTKTYTDMLGRTVRTEQPLPDNGLSVSTVEYNGAGQLVKQVDPDGVTVLYQYNAKGEQEYTCMDMNQDGLWDYDGTDRITRTVSEVGAASIPTASGTVRRTKQYVWQQLETNTPTLVSVSETSVNGLHSWTSSFGLAPTESVTVITPATQTTTVTVTAPDGSSTENEFQSGRLHTVTRYAPGAVVLAQETYGYDQHGRRTTVDDARNGTTTFAFNDADQVVSVTTPDPDGAGSQGAQLTRYYYDSRGRVERVNQPDNTDVYMKYWPTGELRSTWGSRTYPVAYEYDPQGRMTKLSTWQHCDGDPTDSETEKSDGADTAWSYDPYRGLLHEKTYDATGGNPQPGPHYTYTDAGRLETRTWARGVTTTYVYTAGDLISINYPDTTPDVTYTYDRLGRRLTAADGAGTQTLAYNATTGTLDSETRGGGPLNGVAVAWSYDNLRRRSGLEVTHGQTSLASTGYSYDDASRLHTVTSGGNTVAYGYQTNSNLVNTLTFNNGTANVLTTTKTNDYLNRLVSIASVPASASTVSYAYLYNTANQRIRATLADGSYWVYQYDSLGQVVSGQKYWQDETSVGGMQFGYAFDDIGNRTSATTNGRQADYTANLLNEYTEATVPGAFDVLGTANPAATLTINRAAVPNRTGSYYWKTLSVSNTTAPVWQEVKVVGVRKNAGPDAKDVVTESIGHEFVPQTPEAFTYDDDGNMTSDGRWAYTWDGENRLVKMEAASGLPAGARKKLEFAYDGQSRRVEKKSYTWSGSAWVLASDLVFVYDGWNLIAELNANDLSLMRKYCWGLDLSGSLQGAGGVGGLLAVTSTTATQFTAYDGNGNVVALIDAATGTEAARYEYDPFGNTLVQTGTAAAGNPFRFSTKYTDAETGLLYYGLRYYSPRLGRWTSRDPLGDEACLRMQVQARSRAERYELKQDALRPGYIFLGNDSLNWVDRNGLNAAHLIAKMVTGRLPMMVGLDVTSAGVVGVGGAQVWASQVAFFPDTCELAYFAVGPAVLETSNDTNRPAFERALLDMPIGVDISISANISEAVFLGPGRAAAATWEGVFYGAEGGGGPLGRVGVGVFSDPTGHWIGGSAGVGLTATPISLRSSPQMYYMIGSPRVLSTCQCHSLILQIP